jgi:hypothetical protein
MEKNQLSCSQLVFRLSQTLGKRLEAYADKDPGEDELVVKWLDADNPLGGAWVCSSKFRAYLPHTADPGHVERVIELKTKGLPCGLCGVKTTHGCIKCAQAHCPSCGEEYVMKSDTWLTNLCCPFCRSDMSWIIQQVAMEFLAKDQGLT